MADNLTVSIGIDTAKLKADLEVLKAELRKAQAEVKKQSDALVASGSRDNSQVLKAAAAQQALQREVIQTNRALAQQTRIYAGHSLAIAGAEKGLHSLSAAHGEVEEMSTRSTREIIKVSKELGTLEVSGFGVAKMFKELPRVAVPLAVAAGAAAAVAKLSSDAYKAVTSLDDLSKASGFTGREIATLEKVFGDADVGVDALRKTLLSVGESFDKAKVKSMDFGSALSGVQTMRGAAGTAEAGVQVLRGGAAPAPSAIEGRTGVVVMRGGQPFNIEPSKGFAGLIDPNQFKTVEEFFAAVIPRLIELSRVSPGLAREIIRGQGLDPVETLRGMQATTASEYAKALASTAEDARYRQGVVPLARRFGAQAEETGRRREELLTEGGIPSMEAATTVLKGASEGAKTLAEQIAKVREEWTKTADAFTKGTDSGELGAGAKSFADEWTTQFQSIENAWKSTVDHMNALQPSVGGSQAGQVIPVAPEQKAGGGIVGGRGSGDTVPAMLTPGEYVAKRASVAYYGSGFFSALNNLAVPRDLFSRIGYATGGLVGSVQSFAEGGSVGGSTPVHLHLDGQSFTTSATDGVANALVVAARRQQMRSAGVKPSWYGGRPGA